MGCGAWKCDACLALVDRGTAGGRSPEPALTDDPRASTVHLGQDEKSRPSRNTGSHCKTHIVARSTDNSDFFFSPSEKQPVALKRVYNFTTLAGSVRPRAGIKFRNGTSLSLSAEAVGG